MYFPNRLGEHLVRPVCPSSSIDPSHLFPPCLCSLRLLRHSARLATLVAMFAAVAVPTVNADPSLDLFSVYKSTTATYQLETNTVTVGIPATYSSCTFSQPGGGSTFVSTGGNNVDGKLICLGNTNGDVPVNQDVTISRLTKSGTTTQVSFFGPRSLVMSPHTMLPRS